MLDKLVFDRNLPIFTNIYIPLANENMFNYENMIRCHSYLLFHILYRNHTKLSQTIRNSSDLIHYIVYSCEIFYAFVTRYTCHLPINETQTNLVYDKPSFICPAKNKVTDVIRYAGQGLNAFSF